jgi:predicted aspartyl protease
MTVEGHIDEALQIRLPVRVRGQRGIVELSAVVDTGFNGALCLPISVAVTLGLMLSDIASIELADGRIQPELVFEGWVQIGEVPEQLVNILLTFGEEALVGMALLNLLNADLQVRLSQRTVTLTLPETPSA